MNKSEQFIEAMEKKFTQGTVCKINDYPPTLLFEQNAYIRRRRPPAVFLYPFPVLCFENHVHLPRNVSPAIC